MSNMVKLTNEFAKQIRAWLRDEHYEVLMCIGTREDGTDVYEDVFSISEVTVVKFEHTSYEGYVMDINRAPYIFYLKGFEIDIRVLLDGDEEIDIGIEELA